MDAPRLDLTVMLPDSTVRAEPAVGQAAASWQTDVAGRSEEEGEPG